MSATLRVHPRPETSATIVVRNLRRNVEEGDPLAAAFLATQLWWVPGPAILIVTLALAPLLLRRAAWRC